MRLPLAALLFAAITATCAEAPFSYPLHPTDVIGVADSTVGTLITPEGYLFNGWAEFVFLVGSPPRPVNQRLRRLAEGCLPVVEYDVEDNGIVFTFTIFAATLDRQAKPPSPQPGIGSSPALWGGLQLANPINFVRILAVNPTNQARRSGLAAGIRHIHTTDPGVAWRYRFKRPVAPDARVPYEKLPYDVRYYMDGEEFNPRWRYRAVDDCLERDGRALLLFGPGGETRVENEVQPTTLAGVVRYDVALEPGASREFVFKMPTRPVRTDFAELGGIRAANYDAVYERTANEWRARLHGGLGITLGEKKVEDTFRASLAYCYLARDLVGADYRQTPGKLNYHAFYLRDASVFAQAYDLTGHAEDARKVLEYFLKWQQPDGNFVSDMWDGWGQTLWIFGEHAELNRDREFAGRVYPAVERAVHWLEQGLAQDPYGTFPAGPVVDAEYLTGRRGHVTGWNFLGLGGLRGAMKLARLLGRNDDVARYERIYERWKAAFEKRLNEIAPRIGGRIPPGLDDPTGQDGSTWFNLNAIYPVEIFEPWDARVSATLDYSRGRYIEGVARWEGNDRVRAAGGVPRVHAYLTAVNVESALIRGEQQQALAEFYAMLAHTTATHGASEQVLPGTRDPRNQPQPHGWFAANYIVLLRHMLVRERGEELHLLSAVSPQWLKEGGEIRVTRAPTRFGPLDLTVRRGVNSVSIEIAPGFHTPPSAIVVHVPWYLREAVGTGEAVRLKSDARRLEWRFKQAPRLPEMNYSKAVRDLLGEFERTRDYWNEYVRTGRKPTGREEPR
jgi:hypothetical protein